jgi:hypothetical protein
MSQLTHLYRAAAADCPRDFGEGSGAHAALRALGVKP